jgi:ATP-binding cassette subfamily C (CFTR/MRP) protein 1
MVALFRIENLYSGSILIDGIDISKIPLHHLRQKLSIIPQDPVMFSASVRFNLDPFDEVSDEQCWEVLTSVNMKEHVKSLPGQLAEFVVEGGDNFSAGQRQVGLKYCLCIYLICHLLIICICTYIVLQLICIARAILRKPKVLVLDEATASIDSETDSLIQAMLRTKFVDCTVLTIAHRLNTIIDSTRILVLDAGIVVEYDSPDALLNKDNYDGMFRGMWERHLRESKVDDDNNDKEGETKEG